MVTLFDGEVPSLLFFAVIYGTLFLLAGWFLMRESLELIHGTPEEGSESRR